MTLCVVAQVQHMMPQLMALLQSYDYDTVLSYFMAPPVPA